MRIVIAVPASDCHSVVNYLLAAMLRQGGCDVLNLGTNCGILEILQGIESFCPDVAVITCQNGHALEDLKGFGEAIRTHGLEHVPIWIGGRLTTKGRLSLVDRHRLLVNENVSYVYDIDAELDDVVRDIDTWRLKRKQQIQQGARDEC